MYEYGREHYWLLTMAAEAMYIRSKQAEPWLDETHKSLRGPAVTGGREGQHQHQHLDGVDYS